ncbi:MAG: hypothetical protein FJ244_00380 [Nitrospira sp.]|nr:hypothetical protein [Nitrospira sp.]
MASPHTDSHSTVPTSYTPPLPPICTRTKISPTNSVIGLATPLKRRHDGFGSWDVHGLTPHGTGDASSLLQSTGPRSPSRSITNPLAGSARAMK